MIKNYGRLYALGPCNRPIPSGAQVNSLRCVFKASKGTAARRSSDGLSLGFVYHFLTLLEGGFTLHLGLCTAVARFSSKRRSPDAIRPAFLALLIPCVLLFVANWRVYTLLGAANGHLGLQPGNSDYCQEGVPSSGSKFWPGPRIFRRGGMCRLEKKPV